MGEGTAVLPLQLQLLDFLLQRGALFLQTGLRLGELNLVLFQRLDGLNAGGLLLGHMLLQAADLLCRIPVFLVSFFQAFLGRFKLCGRLLPFPFCRDTGGLFLPCALLISSYLLTDSSIFLVGIVKFFARSDQIITKIAFNLEKRSFQLFNLLL